jgi:hypothetical protein
MTPYTRYYCSTQGGRRTKLWQVLGVDDYSAWVVKDTLPLEKAVELLLMLTKGVTG